MTISRTVEVPSKKDIDVSLTLGDEKLEFTLKTKASVDKDALEALDKKMKKEEEAPRRYTELVDLISVSKALIDSYERKEREEPLKKKPDQKRLEATLLKKEKELEGLKRLLEEKEKVGSIPYKAEEIYEAKAKLFCTKGFDALIKHAELFGWRETVHMMGSIIQEAEEKK